MIIMLNNRSRLLAKAYRFSQEMGATTRLYEFSCFSFLSISHIILISPVSQYLLFGNRFSKAEDSQSSQSTKMLEQRSRSIVVTTLAVVMGWGGHHATT
jgi:hypothetical protein